MSITAERLKMVEERGGWVDLSGRAKFRLTGADRVRYLNGQVTNDVRRASDDRALYACVTNIKGKIEADVFIHARDDALFLDAEPDARERLHARLERYIIADDVVLEDVTDDWALWHGFGEEHGAPGMELGKAGRALQSMRFGCPGFDGWFQKSGTMPPAPCSLLSPDEAEALRIIRGVPRWPAELGAETFPPEAGLESAAMDFAKGCYIGQEVLSRIRTTGRMPRQLVKWQSCAAGEQIVTGAEIHVLDASGQGRMAGSVTSVTLHPETERQVGLGYLKQGVLAADSRLLVGGGEPSIAAAIKILS